MLSLIWFKTMIVRNSFKRVLRAILANEILVDTMVTPML